MSNRSWSRSRRKAVGLLGSLIVGVSSSALAADFPDKPITIVVPYSQGSNMSTYARAAAPVLQEELGVPVVVKNIPGATGWNQIYSSEPDGYTIGVGDPTGQIGISIVQPLPYEVDKFVWLGQFASGNQLLVATKKSGLTNLDKLAKAGRTVRCGTFGGLSAGAVQCAMLASEKGFEVAFVNTKGPREVPLAALRGDIDIGSVGVNLWLDHIKKGDVVPIVVWSAKRDQRVPDVSSLTDIGIGDLGALTVYRAVFTTPGVPQDRIDRLRAALSKSQQNAAWKKFIADGKLDNDYIFDDSYQKNLQKAFASVKAQSELINKAFK